MNTETLVQQADIVVKGMSLTNFDIIIFIIISLSTLIALFRGFIKSFISLVGWIVSLVIALHFYEALSPIFIKYTASKNVAGLLSFTTLFLGSSIIIAIINGIIITLLKGATGGILDRSFGLFFGLIRGCLLVSAMFYIMVIVLPELEVKDRDDVMNSEKLPKWAKKSESLLLLSKGAKFIEIILPSRFQENLKKSLTEPKFDNEKNDITISEDYPIKKPKIQIEKGDSIKMMNKLLSSLPQEVVEESTQEDLFLLQDPLSDPAVKVQILEKIAADYQKYTNSMTEGASAEKIKEQSKEYQEVYTLLENEITRYNSKINADDAE